MQPHQERVLKEREDLAEKTCKMGKFFGTEVFLILPDDERERLKKQHRIMGDYLDVLDDRISAFE